MTQHALYNAQTVKYTRIHFSCTIFNFIE